MGSERASRGPGATPAVAGTVGPSINASTDAARPRPLTPFASPSLRPIARLLSEPPRELVNRLATTADRGTRDCTAVVAPFVLGTEGICIGMLEGRPVMRHSRVAMFVQPANAGLQNEPSGPPDIAERAPILHLSAQTLFRCTLDRPSGSRSSQHHGASAMSRIRQHCEARVALLGQPFSIRETVCGRVSAQQLSIF